MNDLVIEIKTEKRQSNPRKIQPTFFEARTEQPEEKEEEREKEKMGDHSKVVLRVSDPESCIISSGRRRRRK